LLLVGGEGFPGPLQEIPFKGGFLVGGGHK
jgi:hypothetical protein